MAGRNELFPNLDKSARGRPEAKWFFATANGFSRPVPAFYLKPSQTGFRPVAKNHWSIPELIPSLDKSAPGRHEGKWFFATEMAGRPVVKNQIHMDLPFDMDDPLPSGARESPELILGCMKPGKYGKR